MPTHREAMGSWTAKKLFWFYLPFVSSQCSWRSCSFCEPGEIHGQQPFVKASPACCKAKDPRTWRPICRKIGKLQYCVSWLWSISTNKSKGWAAKNPCHIAYVSIFSPLSPGPVFSLNFSSACKGSFMAGKAKICPRGALSWGRRVMEQWETWPHPRRSLKFFERSFSHFKTSFPQISHCYLYTAIYPNNFMLSSMFSFQNAWPIKRKAVYT